MDNRRNSGSYSSRVANPPSHSQPLPDGYPQKRNSYRRPPDAQPMPTHTQAPVTTENATPSNSARAVSTAAPTNGVARTSSHRRRQSQQIPLSANGATSDALPAAPDVPRGPPPTSYRDPYAPKGSSRPSRPYASRPRDPTLQVNASRQQPTMQIPPARLQELRPDAFSPTEPQSAVIEGQGRRPSVPDRSPLQKLEGKLDDISKEEKRARMLEIELAAQEKAEADMRARRAREAAAKQQRNVSGPVPGANRTSYPPGQTASARRHVSMPTQAPKSPAMDSVDGSEVGYDISEPWDPAGAAITSGVYDHSKRLSQVDTAVGRKPSVKGKEPVGVSRGTGSFRQRTAAVPARGERAEQTPQRITRKPVSGPSGLGLYGVEDPTKPVSGGIARYDSKRVTKDLPPIPQDRDAIQYNDRRRDSRGIQAAQMEMEQQRIDRKNDRVSPTAPPPPAVPIATTATAPVRKGVGFDPALPEPEEHVTPAPHHHIKDVFSNHEPDRRYQAPTMLDEWRNAPIATLGAADLDLEAPERSDSTKKAWWEESTSTRRRRSSGGHAQTSYDGYADEPAVQTSFNPPLYLKCGPLLRYTGIRKDPSRAGREIWRGSVMIVTVDDMSSYQKPPTLRLFKQPMDLLPPPPAEIDSEGQPLNPAYVDPIEGQTKVSRSGKTLYVKPVDEIPENEDLSRVEDDTGLFQEARTTLNGYPSQKTSRIRKRDGEKLGKLREIPAMRLHAERGVTFWRFNLEIELGVNQARIAYRINRGPAIGFWVPARGETMNIMFHSCNGFSLSVDSKDFCGPDPLWRDVLNNHQTRPFHVMIGGGDQIYNDAAMRQTTLFRQWTESRNPMQKHNTSFSSELQNELEQFYLDRYSMWFSQGLFGMANSQIPMVNIWDDHDIIDGYGSYPHHFMSTPVFTGLGAVAFKYYMLFQHQSVLAETDKTEPSWILGAHPGPYIKEQSRSVFMSLGHSVAFLGLDCRTERQRDEILTEDSYDIIFDRLEEEIIKGETKHLIVLLGVPIAYPRLNFLENILTSRLMDPIKALGRTGMLGGFVNKFDGGVEILDDLDDHWTAKHHKDERNWFIRELQHIASTKSVRVTILGGDVHLAAVGQFYTNKKLNLAKDKDFRYMPNIVSSAIVNTPPPEMMADIINKRNKVHHLDPYTDEDMIPLFTHDTDGKKRNNTHLLPRRNWCSLREYKPGSTPPSSPSPPPSPGPEGPRIQRTFSDSGPGKMVRRISGSRRGRDPGPPMAYYNNPAYAAADEEQAGAKSSFSPEREERPRSRRSSLSSLFRRRKSYDGSDTPGSVQSLPTQQAARSGSVSAERPSAFHRRASVLSKKGMKRQGEFINLEGGLDICLNLEVSQKDPAGITTPYRLLVPKLDYTVPEPAAGAVEKERRKSRIGSIFGGLRNRSRPRRTVGDDGYSHSGGSEDEYQSDDLGEVDEEERARQRYKVGPRTLITGFSKKRQTVSANYADPPHSAGHDRRESESVEPHHFTSRGSDAFAPSYATGISGRGGDTTTKPRHVSAPITSHSNTQTQTAANTQPSTSYHQTQALPYRSGSTRQPMSNSSHKSQLPNPATQTPALPPPVPEPKVHRRSMGGILNQHRGPAFEHSAHVATHTPKQQKRESYPPHPAIVGAGPGSPYSRGGVEPRSDYFASGGRNGTAGVGAKYLGGGKYAGDDEDLSDDDSISSIEDYRRGGSGGGAGKMARFYGDAAAGRKDGNRHEHGQGHPYGGGVDKHERYSDEGSVSQDSFVPPKPKAKWKIWKS